MITNRTSFEDQVEQIIRTSEIMAVVRALQSGRAPRVGQTIDYYIEPEASARPATGMYVAKQGKPYRVTIEQWHLDSALRMVK